MYNVKISANPLTEYGNHDIITTVQGTIQNEWKGAHSKCLSLIF